MWKSVTKYQSTLRKIQENEDLVYTAAKAWNHAKSKHTFYVQLIIFLNYAVDEIMWKYTVQPVRPQMTMWRMHSTCWIPKAYKHTFRICNTYCFSTATMGTRIRFNVTLYTHCLSYFLLAFVFFSIAFIFNNKNVEQFKEEYLISINAYDTITQKNMWCRY
jgi:hypothetical protein